MSGFQEHDVSRPDFELALSSNFTVI